jgi:hypothetical protein
MLAYGETEREHEDRLPNLYTEGFRHGGKV